MVLKTLSNRRMEIMTTITAQYTAQPLSKKGLREANKLIKEHSYKPQSFLYEQSNNCTCIGKVDQLMSHTKDLLEGTLSTHHAE